MLIEITSHIYIRIVVAKVEYNFLAGWKTWWKSFNNHVN